MEIYETYYQEQKCIICMEKFDNQEDVVTVLEKGLANLITTSNEKQMFHMKTFLENSQRNVFVHHECRRSFTDKRKCNHTYKATRPIKQLRSSVETFDFKTKCCLCFKVFDKRNLKKDSIKEVRTLPMLAKLKERAFEREDDWGEDVLSNLQTVNDLIAAEAKYHNSCNLNFKRFKVPGVKLGRPANQNMIKAFEKVCNFLEEDGDCELYTLKEIHHKMSEFSENDEMISVKWLKEMLKGYYKEHIYFTNLPRREDVLCFKDMASFFLYKMKKDSETKENVIMTAARIIKSEIRELEKTMDEYPVLEDLSNIEKNKEWVPESLQLLLKCLIPTPLKQLSIGQCITQSSRPRSIMCPIVFGLGVQLDKSYASKWLLNQLHRFGYSISSDEVLRYKQSAIVHDAENPLDTTEEHFCQWAADNVDHNLVTLTGKGTFHGMGVISMSSKGTFNQSLIKRLQKRQKAEDVVKAKGIPILNYFGKSELGLLKIKFKAVEDLTIAISLPKELSYNLLWQLGWFYSSSQKPQANWSGFMQDMTRNYSSQREDCITFLPIIDLASSDENCIYSTLMFIIEQAKKSGIPTPCVTFDQPLFIKALGIIEERNLDMVCRLGGFHMMMSFLGSLGALMKGSGLEDLFAEVYAERAVTHMMSGKAVSRALRAHFLAEAALTSLLLESVAQDNSIDENELQSMLNVVLEDDSKETIEEFLDLDMIKEMEKALSELKSKLRRESRTAKLWLLYLDYMSVLKMFILAERTSDWNLHLKAVLAMINLFAASGHIHYAKSARIYLQKMLNLFETHPWLHNSFINGFHAVRRSNRHWSGLWTDLVIEQTLMRSVSTRGGLTRGRGMTDSTRHMWVLSSSHTASVHLAMMELSGLNIKTSEQHVDTTKASKKHDFEHYTIFKEWLQERNPFNFVDEHLHSLSSGWTSISGQDDVNCEEAEEIGQKIHQTLENQNLASASIKRKDRFRSLDSLKNAVTIEKKKIFIDPIKLFTRNAAIAERGEEDVEPNFAFEMTHYPPSIFKDDLMRKPDKSALRRVLMPDDDAFFPIEIAQNAHYVVDGGSLLHRVRWMKNSTFKELAELYVSYVRRHYGSASVVFDGYETVSTKASEHLRRSKQGNKCQNVDIFEINIVPTSQDRFLSNQYNKVQFIDLITKYLKEDSQNVINCDGDADTQVVKTALEFASDTSIPVVVVADDTDIAVMLLYHWKREFSDIIFFMERSHKCWNLRTVLQKNEDIKDHLLFIHAWSGCDTVSATFGKGKVTFLNLVKNSEKLKEISILMNDFETAQNQVGSCAETVFQIMYNGREGDTLTKLRYRKYMEMVTKGIIEPEKMPPTERAAYFHGLRVHHQILIWKFDFLDPIEWGFTLKENALFPIQTDKPVAPECILNIVRCNCKSSNNQCGTNRCSCRKNGLSCMTSCGECHGEECENKKEKACVEYDLNDEYEDDDIEHLLGDYI